MREPYEKPVIKKLLTGLINKFGVSPAYARRVREAIGGVPVADLVDQFGSPLFVFVEGEIRRRYREAYSAFSRRYPNVGFGWSYKTNYLLAVCAIMHQEGALAEVVSEMEYEKARALGIPGQDIIFNGPYKPPRILSQAAAEGAAINVDHLDEVHDLEAIAGALGRPLRVGMRLNLDAGIYPQWSRFGFNLEGGQALDAARFIARSGRLVLNGLHCHIGTFVTDAAAYGREAEKMARFAAEVEEQIGFAIEYIDVGGGFPSRNRLKGSYLSPDVSVPSFDEFAEQICHALSENLRPGHLPKLLVESGRALIDEAGFLIATVVAAKRCPDGTRAYVADAGINLLVTSAWYKLNVELDRDVTGVNEQSVIYGPLCMNLDALDEGVLLPPLTRGVRLIFSPAGAYNNTQWMQFTQYRPAVVLIGEDGQVDLIRQAEDLTDVAGRERLPDRLARAEP